MEKGFSKYIIHVKDESWQQKIPSLLSINTYFFSVYVNVRKITDY